ncbi:MULTISPECIES: hypothetical protein [Streptomyces]|uniref:hypothetical protein n=1 Tax=Streptomyces TaxID=1883 RepID=UPI002E274118|nr:hypothetical protein OH837_31595 [Streptomyces canus]WSZ30819.1 hypothetical protein OG806_15855 [Streptomyces sp. NBC_00882]WSZ57667.1 hypothetical protein OH824_14380 [Streptomyces canus]
MSSPEFLLDDLTDAPGIDVEAALDPVEADGYYRDSRQCAALALVSSSSQLLLSPPTPRPKKG